MDQQETINIFGKHYVVADLPSTVIRVIQHINAVTAEIDELGFRRERLEYTHTSLLGELATQIKQFDEDREVEEV